MPGNTIQVFLNGLEGKTYTLNLDEVMTPRTQTWKRGSIVNGSNSTVLQGASIADLRQICSEKSGVPDEDMRIITGTKEIRAVNPKGEALSLSDYNIGNDSNVFLVLRLAGGSSETVEDDVFEESNTSSEESSEEETTYEPKMYASEIQLTDKPDMFTLDDETDGQRAEMPCGHAIGPESLTAYCRSLLSAGKYEFRCPYKNKSTDPFCDALWEFFTVKRLAVLTKAELKEFETKMTDNYLRKAIGIQECPRCHSFCERKNKKDKRVVCPICTRQKGQLYEFCWYCLKAWLTSGTSECGNLSCTGEDPRLRIIKNSPKKMVVGVPNCPAVRACPECGMLIEHKEACKQMVCRCGQKFCFICLTKASTFGRYQCGLWNTKCDVAPIQTSLPGE